MFELQFHSSSPSSCTFTKLILNWLNSVSPIESQGMLFKNLSFILFVTASLDYLGSRIRRHQLEDFTHIDHRWTVGKAAVAEYGAKRLLFGDFFDNAVQNLLFKQAMRSLSL